MTFVNIAPIGGYVTGDLIDESQINYWCSALPDAIDGAGGGTYTLSAPLIINGDDIEFGEDLLVEGSLRVAGNLTVLDHDLSIGLTDADEFSCLASAYFYSDIQIGNSGSDSVTLNSVIRPNGGGRILHTGIMANDADQSIPISSYRHICIPSSVTAERTYTLTSAAEQDGEWFVIQNLDSISHKIEGLITTTIPADSGFKSLRIGGTWRTVMLWKST